MPRINVKKKGNLWENKLAKWLHSHGYRAWRDSASGGGSREKGDVGNDIDMTIESKASKNIKLMEWWEQVDRSASVHKNEPVLFIHQDGMPDNTWLVVMHSDDWIELIKGEDKRDIVFDDPSKKYAVQRAIDSLKTLLKQFDV